MTTTTIIILLAAAVAVLVLPVALLLWHAHRQEGDMKLKNDVIIREVKKNDHLKDHLKEELRESRQMKKIAVMVAVAMMTAMSVQGQIPAEVKDILQKCSEKNHHSGGTEIDMKLHVGAVIASMNGTIKICKKGDKSFSVFKMKALGREIYSEKGFDGTQEWTYSKATDDDERDSLIITKVAKRSKDKYSVNLGLDKDYKKAKLKTTDKFYEITFTGPLKKEMPRKSIIRIVKDTYQLHEYETKVSIASMKMTITKIKYGVSDNLFVLDLKKYPNAVVVRK